MTNEPTGDWAQTVVHLLALADRMEGHGQLNIAKLARAAADSLARRAAYLLNLPQDPDALASDLGHLLAILPGFGLNDTLATAMKQGKAAMTEGRLPLYEELPNPHVCRTCGELLLGPPAGPCVVCGAWPATFQQFKPVYWLDALQPREALVQLAATPDIVAGNLEGLTEEQLGRPPADGGWSMRQVLAHMRDAESVLRARVQLMMEQENPTLEALAVFEWATSEDDRPPATEAIFEDYRQSRHQTLTFLKELSPWDWWRTGRHKEFGTVTILNQASYFSTHEQTHLADLAMLKAANLT